MFKNSVNRLAVLFIVNLYLSLFWRFFEFILTQNHQIEKPQEKFFFPAVLIF